jgi:hypothetical protein
MKANGDKWLTFDMFVLTINEVNSFQATAPLTAHGNGVIFRGHISLKNWTYFPLLDMIQPLSSTHAFLLVKKKRRLLCMGRTSTANKPLPLNNSPKPICGSWESNPARVKARLVPASSMC